MNYKGRDPRPFEANDYDQDYHCDHVYHPWNPAYCGGETPYCTLSREKHAPGEPIFGYRPPNWQQIIDESLSRCMAYKEAATNQGTRRTLRTLRSRIPSKKGPEVGERYTYNQY
jgi:hypothetical protein